MNRSKEKRGKHPNLKNTIALGKGVKLLAMIGIMKTNEIKTVFLHDKLASIQAATVRITSKEKTTKKDLTEKIAIMIIEQRIDGKLIGTKSYLLTKMTTEKRMMVIVEVLGTTKSLKSQNVHTGGIATTTGAATKSEAATGTTAMRRLAGPKSASSRTSASTATKKLRPKHEEKVYITKVVQTHQKSLNPTTTEADTGNTTQMMTDFMMNTDTSSLNSHITTLVEKRTIEGTRMLSTRRKNTTKMDTNTKDSI